MKIFVTGAAGMLADEVIKKFRENDHEVIGYDINQRLPEIKILDIRNKNDVFIAIEEENPDFVFHLAAETNVDLCEQNPDHAYKTNTIGTENVAYACQKLDLPMLYISTGGVFDGEKAEAYTEFDTPAPRHVYGMSKWQGELAVQKLLSKYFIVRAGWMIGGWELDKKFVYKIANFLKDGKRELKVVNDKFGCPCFTCDFANNLYTLIESDAYGLYHMVNQGVCSRLDIAEKIVEYMGLSGKVKIESVNSACFPLPAPRGRSEALRNYRLDLIGLNLMPSWQEGLKQYITNNI